VTIKVPADCATLYVACESDMEPVAAVLTVVTAVALLVDWAAAVPELLDPVVHALTNMKAARAARGRNRLLENIQSSSSSQFDRRFDRQRDLASACARYSGNFFSEQLSRIGDCLRLPTVFSCAAGFFLSPGGSRSGHRMAVAFRGENRHIPWRKNVTRADREPIYRCFCSAHRPPESAFAVDAWGDVERIQRAPDRRCLAGFRRGRRDDLYIF